MQVIALVLTYAGIALAFLDDIDPQLQTNLPLGAALVFASAVVYALYLVGTGEVLPRVGSGRFTCYAMLAAAGVGRAAAGAAGAGAHEAWGGAEAAWGGAGGAWAGATGARAAGATLMCRAGATGAAGGGGLTS